MDFVDFDGQRDSRGYVSKAAQKRGRKGATLLTGVSAKPLRIERRGGKLESIRPTAENPKLHLEFSQVRTADDLVAFMNRYGALTNAIEVFGYERVGEILEYAREMRDLIGADRMRTMVVAEGGRLDISGLTAALIVDRLTGEMRFQFRARNLLDALRMQFSQDLIGDKLGLCLKCGVPFRRGVGTGRRGDALFCSDAHRELFKSHNRSAKRKG